MKIIASNPKGYSDCRFIVEATETELRMIAFGDPHFRDGPPIGIGIVLDVNAIFSRLAKMRANQKELAGAASTLRALAALLDPIDQVIANAITVPPEPAAQNAGIEL